MLYLETKWASLVSSGASVDLLRDFLPVGETLNAQTVRNHLHRTASRAEAELGDEQFAFIDGCRSIWRDLPHPEGPIVVGIDGGYVRWREDEGSHFEVTVGKSITEDRADRYFGLVQSFDAKPKRRLHEVLKEQGMQMNQEITFLTDGGDTVRNLAADMSPCAEHILDWFHITMRLTVLGQYAKGLAHHDKQAAEEAETHLAKIKGYLWNGNVREAKFRLEWLVDDLDLLQSDYPVTQPPETGPRIRGICSTLVREEDRCARVVSVKSRSSGSCESTRPGRSSMSSAGGTTSRRPRSINGGPSTAG